jgi:hypothetical protein
VEPNSPLQEVEHKLQEVDSQQEVERSSQWHEEELNNLLQGAEHKPQEVEHSSQEEVLNL